MLWQNSNFQAPAAKVMLTEDLLFNSESLQLYLSISAEKRLEKFNPASLEDAQEKRQLVNTEMDVLGLNAADKILVTELKL